DDGQRREPLRVRVDRVRVLRRGAFPPVPVVDDVAVGVAEHRGVDLGTSIAHSSSVPPTAATDASGRRSRRRNSWALSATTTVDNDMRMAPAAIGRTNPTGARTP